MTKERPYYIIYPPRKNYQPCLELDSDGAFASAMEFLNTLTHAFGATCEPHLEAGPRPAADKEKGY